MTTGNLTCTTLTVSGAVTTGALTCSGLLTANGGLTVASGQTLTLTGATVAGAPTWSSSQAITLSTAAQPNVTSVGTLTGLTTSGAINAGSNSISGGAISGTTGTFSGNLAIGGASLQTYSGAITNALDMRNGVNIAAGFNTLPVMYINANIGGFNGSAWTYKQSLAAAQIAVDANTGVIDTYIAASGTAGNAITFNKVTEVSSTGLAVTGTLSATTQANIGAASFSTSGILQSKSTVASTQAATLWNADTTGTRYLGYFGTEASFTARGALVYNATNGFGLTEPTGNTGIFLSSSGMVTINGTGPHAIGRGIDAGVQLDLGGSFSGGSYALGFVVNSTLTPTASNDAAGIYVAPTLTKAGSGTHTNFDGAVFNAPTITAGAATLTNASTVRIAAAPSVGTNQRALWVAAGMSQFDGGIGVTGTITSTNYINLFNGTSIPAGGAANTGLFFGTSAAIGVYFGSGAPSVSAPKGSLYLRSDGTSTSTRAYINTDGGTAWTAITTAS